jgi:hypothetical protein
MSHISIFKTDNFKCVKYDTLFFNEFTNAFYELSYADH